MLQMFWYDVYKNSQAGNKCRAVKSQGEKRYEIKDSGQEMVVMVARVYNVLGRVSTMLWPVKNEPVKSYGIIQTTQWFVLIGKKIRSTRCGACKHVKKAEATERNNSVVCGVACWGTKYKEKHGD